MSRLFPSLFALALGLATSQTIPDYRITSTRKYANTHPFASVNVRQIGRNPALKPVVFVEGFDIYNGDDLNALQANLEKSGTDLKQALLDKGYTLFIVDFANSQDYIQSNALALIDVFDDCWARSLKREPIKVVGMSMGGIVARYALDRAENLGLDHHCNLYVSFDAPHKGAYIPMSVQSFAEFFAGMNDDAKQFDQILNSTAATQLLIVSNAPVNRNQLLLELRMFGYPKKTRNVAITNGLVNGQGQGIGDRQLAVTWDLSGPSYTKASARLYTAPYNYRNGGRCFYGSKVEPFGSNSNTVTFQGGWASLDNAPGGIFDSYKMVADKLPVDPNFHFYGMSFSTSTSAQMNIKSHSFVPTISALDIKDWDIEDNANLGYNLASWSDIASHTPFARVFYPSYSTVNEHHGRITPQNMQFILDEIKAATKPTVPLAAINFLLQ